MGVNPISSDVYNFSEPLCSWQGVVCDTQKKYVIGLLASGLDLSILIPESTIGSIPVGILKCQNLVSVIITFNQITGTIPDGFSIAFPKLKNLDISGNAIQGRSLDISGMKSITYLNISMNLFKGSVMGVFEAPLEVIDLSRNQFHGHISQVNANSSFNWSHLVYFDLSENQLSGESFHDLNDAYNLKHLNLAHNRFSQQEFPEISKLPSLEYLNLSRTSMIGKIPTEISYLTSLTTLDLFENHLTSQIPDLNVKNLHVLNLSLNNLTGQVPIPLLENLH
ncbi:hypothetical protein GIB67_031652 [Kingdonia uniflora]|uniref:Leucine-rich repeat-containing N-terminal plant-type domain-containing protein n=1 Tax=Kingdonia uniflora TaxID=39325 RepID=A0A7J7NJL5_9MAGN|nr:hypothetical protein GIB67_031652 [Kingdonia uniflora]